MGGSVSYLSRGGMRGHSWTPHISLTTSSASYIACCRATSLASSWMVIVLTNEFAGVVAPRRGSATDGELVGAAREVGEASPPPVPPALKDIFDRWGEGKSVLWTWGGGVGAVLEGICVGGRGADRTPAGATFAPSDSHPRATAAAERQSCCRSVCLCPSSTPHLPSGHIREACVLESLLASVKPSPACGRHSRNSWNGLALPTNGTQRS
jgi:hypothetical protein